MPSLSIPMNPLADLFFPTHMKKLPVDWSQPTGEAADHYGQSFEMSEKVAVLGAGAFGTALGKLLAEGGGGT